MEPPHDPLDDESDRWERLRARRLIVLALGIGPIALLLTLAAVVLVWKGCQ